MARPATEQGYPGWSKIDFDNEFFWHRWGGVIVAVVATIFAFVAMAAIRSGSESLSKVWKVGLLVVAGMVGAVGHQGGELTYGKDFYPRAFRILLGTDGTEVERDITEDQPKEPDHAAK